MRRPPLCTATVVLAMIMAGTAVTAVPAHARPAEPPKQPVAVGSGGAVSTVDATATAVGLDVLRRGGNAVDAAVAAAATLGVTEPFSAGIGGGGFFVHYDAKTGKVHTIDGRESAPASMTETSFINPDTGQQYALQEARISGLSVGVPGTLLTWQDALDRWGTRSLAELLEPAAEVAEEGFTVDQTFTDQIAGNRAAFGQFSSTSALYLPKGQPPVVGSTFRNPDLAKTYALIAERGTDVFYAGQVGHDIVRTVQRPPLAKEPVAPWPFTVRPAGMTAADLAGYRTRFPEPTRSDYRGLEVYGMSTPSSGGTAVGEALNILEQFDLRGMTTTQALHHYLEASALAFADRNRYVGDGTPASVLRELLSDAYAKERACLIDPTRATLPVPPGDPDRAYGGCTAAPAADALADGKSTTNLTVADRWGNVVEYTLTIEATGGNGMVVPGRGFLLNNELTDFNFAPTQGTAPDPNLPAPGKRPRSSMSPTIVLADGRPFVAVGTPGGATIITTVLQMLVNRIDLGMSLPEALAAPRASQRNSASTQAEPAFIEQAGGLTDLGHRFSPTAEIGAATGIEFLPDGQFLAAAEPVRRGGGAAAVVDRREPDA